MLFDKATEAKIKVSADIEPEAGCLIAGYSQPIRVIIVGFKWNEDKKREGKSSLPSKQAS